MARKRTYYPTMNQKLYDTFDYMNTYLQRTVEKTTIAGTAQETALTNIQTALKTNLANLPRYREAA